jgi:hypothetical protein
MTMTTHRPTAQASLDRLVRCSELETGTSAWWACLARHLDELGEELSLVDIEGLVAQVITDTPELAADATRLSALDCDVRAEVLDLRLQVAAMAGRPEAVVDIRDAVDATLRRVSSLDQFSGRLLFEAYERDFGGE